MDRCLHVKKKPDRSSWPLQKGDRKPEEFLVGSSWICYFSVIFLKRCEKNVVRI